MPGYSLEQLLTWCRDDRLIDAFYWEGNEIVVYRQGTRYIFQPDEALGWIRALYSHAAQKRIKWPSATERRDRA